MMSAVFATLGALAGVLFLAYGSLRLLRRLTLPRLEAELQFLASLPLGPRERLVVVSWRDRDLMLGVGGGGVTLLAHAERGASNVQDAANASSPVPASSEPGA